MSQTNDLGQIYIRAKNKKGGWDSLSLEELLAQGESGHGQIALWFLSKIGLCDDWPGLGEYDVKHMIQSLEANGIPVVRIVGGDNESSKVS